MPTPSFDSKASNDKRLRLLVHDVGVLHLAVRIERSDLFGTLKFKVVALEAVVAVVHGVHVAVDDAALGLALVLRVNELLRSGLALIEFLRVPESVSTQWSKHFCGLVSKLALA